MLKNISNFVCTISNHLSANNTAANLLTTNISTTSLLTAAPNNLSATNTDNILTAATINLSIPNISSNPAKFSYYDIKKPEIQNYLKLEISNGNLLTNFQLLSPTNGITFSEFGNWNYLSLLITLENAQSNELKTNLQLTLTSNIPPATITEDELLTAIFFFEIEELSEVFLFSGAALKEKSIMAIYIDAKINSHSIKLILDTNGATKTLIGEIDNLPIKINGIIVLIKLSQNGQHTWVPATCGHFKPITTPSTPLIEFEEEKAKPIWEAYQVFWADTDHNELPLILSWDNNGKRKKKEELTWKTNELIWTDNDDKTTTAEEITSDWKRKYSHEPIKEPPYILLKYKNCGKKLFSIGAWVAPDENYWIPAIENDTDIQNTKQLLDEGIWNNILGQERMYNASCQYTIFISDWHQAIFCLDSYPHDENEIWQMANAKIIEAMPSKILEIKNNLPEQMLSSTLKPTQKTFMSITKIWHPPEKNRKSYCDLIYNLLSCIIYTIPEEKEPISSCTLELESIFDPNLNSDNDDNENIGSSSIQNGNNNNYNSNLNSNSDS
ncbi:hypothetical protein G9A89_008664 [Geosiphon pyriformis]|nr:hypothetical protein G9A89_008664 [Geosiphon pyriformis]